MTDRKLTKAMTDNLERDDNVKIYFVDSSQL